MKIGDINVNYPGCPAILADGHIWLPCDGRLVSRKAYPVLYSVIGMAHADEDKRCCNAELFPLPDYSEPEIIHCYCCKRVMSREEARDQGRVCHECARKNMKLH